MLPLKYQQAKKRPIEGGLVNSCYQLILADECYFLREGVPYAHMLGIDRHRELHILRHSLASELSPELLYAEPETGLLVSRWVDLHPESQTYWQTEEGIANLAELLVRIHSSSLRGSYPAISMDPACQLRFYLARICTRRGEQTLFANRALTLLARLPTYPSVLCHNDLNPGNLLGRGKWVVDWEYAALGDAAFDIAVVCRAFDFSLQQQRYLIEHYQHLGGNCSLDRLSVMLPVVDVMNLLWLAVYRQLNKNTILDAMYQALLEKMMAEKGEW